MLSLSSLSRRALVAAAAFAAFAPNAQAGKQKHPPLVFVGATLTAVNKGTNGDQFAWSYLGRLYHPDSRTVLSVNGFIELLAKTSSGDVRTRLVTELKSQAANELAGVGHDVPQDRIAVTLL